MNSLSELISFFFGVWTLEAPNRITSLNRWQFHLWAPKGFELWNGMVAFVFRQIHFGTYISWKLRNFKPSNNIPGLLDELYGFLKKFSCHSLSIAFFIFSTRIVNQKSLPFLILSASAKIKIKIKKTLSQNANGLLIFKRSAARIPTNWHS